MRHANSGGKNPLTLISPRGVGHFSEPPLSRYQTFREVTNHYLCMHSAIAQFHTIIVNMSSNA